MMMCGLNWAECCSTKPVRFVVTSKAERVALVKDAITAFERALKIDSESFRAHYNLSLLYTELSDTEMANYHQEMHERYKDDDVIRGQAIPAAREKYPAANHASEPLVIYPLQRLGAAELPAEAAVAGGQPVPAATTSISGGE